MSADKSKLPPGHVAIVWSMEVIIRSYRAASKVHEDAGLRHVTMLILAAFIVESHSRLVKCSTEETLHLVRDAIDAVRLQMP